MALMALMAALGCGLSKRPFLCDTHSLAAVRLNAVCEMASGERSWKAYGRFMEGVWKVHVMRCTSSCACVLKNA